MKDIAKCVPITDRSSCFGSFAERAVYAVMLKILLKYITAFHVKLCLLHVLQSPMMGWWGKVTTTLISLLLYKKVCYHDNNIGCFDNKSPYNNAFRKVPQSPDRNGVSIII